MTEKTDNKQTHLWGKGQSGNPAGRPVGARNKATLAVQALLDGEAEALSRKAVELALQGDLAAIRLCLERILPPRKDAPVEFTLPQVTSASDISQIQATIMQAVAEGRLTPMEGTNISAIAETMRKAKETQEFETRLEALEKVASKGGK